MINHDLFKKALGKHLRLIRLENNKTLEELGESAKLDHINLGKIERGEKLPTLITLFKIFLGMKISIDRLFNSIKKDLDL